MKNLNQMYNIPENLFIHVQHLHNGNTTSKQRSGHEYVTVVHIVDENDKVTTAKSVCSPNDTPNRKRGRDIAIGRAWKKYNKGK